jgi:hypothetical protein
MQIRGYNERTAFLTRELCGSTMSLCVVFKESPDHFGNDLLNLARPDRAKQFGGHKAVVRPVPIPNTAVKHSLADGSGCIASARVGCRQSFNKIPGENTPGILCFKHPCLQTIEPAAYFKFQTQLSPNFLPSRSARASTRFSPGDNFMFFQIKTQFVASVRLPCGIPFNSNSTFFALE